MKRCRQIFKWWWLLLIIMACATTPDEKPFQPVAMTLAVFDFEDVSPFNKAMVDSSDVLTVKAIETIYETGRFDIVERQRLSMILEELNIGTSDLADRETQLRLGSITGARLMVFGYYQVIEDQLRLDIRLVDVESGRVLNAVSELAEENTLPGWLDAVAKSIKALFQF